MLQCRCAGVSTPAVSPMLHLIAASPAGGVLSSIPGGPCPITVNGPWA